MENINYLFDAILNDYFNYDYKLNIDNMNTYYSTLIRHDKIIYLGLL